ncbi:MAG: hypothetical protein KKB20_10650 [Proteobacteria bacterium]|nr:hypothetical protein [Pseudomonadota bacterium]
MVRYDPLQPLPDKDLALTPEVAEWLKPGPQSIITPAIREVAGSLSHGSRRERLYQGLGYIWTCFKYDAWLNDRQFTRTADELFQSRTLGGCSEFALAELAILRALDIPTRLVVTANAAWMERSRENDLGIPAGHSFLEVFLEREWYLVDSTWRWIYPGYDPESSHYPHGETFLARGRDFWDLGLRNVEQANDMLLKKAKDYTGGFREPGYARIPY